MLSPEEARRLFEQALIEFAPEWEVVDVYEVNSRDRDHWPSGDRTFGFTIQHQTSGSMKVLGRRKGDEPTASYHRGVSFRLLEAYNSRFTEPITRYLEEIDVGKETKVPLKKIGAPSFTRRGAQIFYRGRAKKSGAEINGPRRDEPRTPAAAPKAEVESVPPEAGPSSDPNALQTLARSEVREDDREPVARWIQEAKALLPDLLEQHEQLRARAAAVQHECEQLRDEMNRLRSENHQGQTERDELGEAMRKLMSRMLQLMDETASKVRARTTASGAPSSVGS